MRSDSRDGPGCADHMFDGWSPNTFRRSLIGSGTKFARASCRPRCATRTVHPSSGSPKNLQDLPQLMRAFTSGCGQIVRRSTAQVSFTWKFDCPALSHCESSQLLPKLQHTYTASARLRSLAIPALDQTKTEIPGAPAGGSNTHCAFELINSCTTQFRYLASGRMHPSMPNTRSIQHYQVCLQHYQKCVLVGSAEWCDLLDIDKLSSVGPHRPTATFIENMQSSLMSYEFCEQFWCQPYFPLKSYIYIQVEYWLAGTRSHK